MLGFLPLLLQNPPPHSVRDVFRAEHQPFYAGFGNRDTDLLSYRAVGVHPSKVFIIDPSGAIAQANRHLRTSYPQLTDLVASMFPPHDAQPRAAAQETAFADLGFWRAPIRAPTAGDVSAWF